ncbi:MAG: hypothetical protein M9894_14385 [Planctomycetes bacterium]|nr:hypothetical protein [Planctomycetota bacterium]
MSPGYTIKDAYEYGGGILAAAAASIIARGYGLDGRWEVLGVAVVAGFAGGFVGNRLYWAGRRRPDDDDGVMPPPPSS